MGGWSQVFGHGGMDDFLITRPLQLHACVRVCMCDPMHSEASVRHRTGRSPVKLFLLKGSNSFSWFFSLSVSRLALYCRLLCVRACEVGVSSYRKYIFMSLVFALQIFGYKDFHPCVLARAILTILLACPINELLFGTFYKQNIEF